MTVIDANVTGNDANMKEIDAIFNRAKKKEKPVRSLPIF
jgi:hypothetical protein